MSDITLRLPYLIYLALGSMLLGVLIAPAFRDLPPTELPVSQSMAEHDGMHGTIEVPPEGAPEVSMDIAKDPKGGWNISLRTGNFIFTPEAVNLENTPNSGHAHLYVDGLKMARLYGPHFHMPDLVPGQHEITVALSSNDHSFYVVEGVRIEARAMVMQREEPVSGS